jgi:hypothetical protein
MTQNQKQLGLGAVIRKIGKQWAEATTAKANSRWARSLP